MKTKKYIYYKNVTFCCKKCGDKICSTTALYGQGMCCSCSHKDKHQSKETKLKRSNATRGEKHYLFGKHRSEETRKKISNTIKNKYKSTVHYNLGKRRSKIARIRMSKAHKGKHLSNEHRKKISESNKGRKCYWLGKQMSEKTKKKMSKSSKGKKNHRYIDGLSCSQYYWEFNETLKNKIRQRDNFSCQCCEKQQIDCERALPVHHIDYNKHNCKENNLITLCISCHAKTSGNKELDRDYWYAYCTYLMENR